MRELYPRYLIALLLGIVLGNTIIWVAQNSYMISIVAIVIVAAWTHFTDQPARHLFTTVTATCLALGILLGSGDVWQLLLGLSRIFS